MTTIPTDVTSRTIYEHFGVSLYAMATSSYSTLTIRDGQASHWLLSHVLAGQVEMSSSGEHWSVRQGEVMLHPPHVPFSEIAETAGIHQWLMFDLALGPNIDLFSLYPVTPVVPLLDAAAFSATFEALRSVWENTDAFIRHLQASALLLQLFGTVLESWKQAGAVQRPANAETNSDRMIKVVLYMQQHLDHKLSRSELAALVHLHPGHFDHVFRLIYGLSPMQMLRDLRLRRACQLLESTNASLATIAARCGLGDAAYFSRIFQQRYALSPGRYRQTAKSTITPYISALSERPS